MMEDVWLRLAGLGIGIGTFLTIGLFHPVVIKAEYYWGTRCWWLFLLLGLGGVAASVCVENLFWSSLLGVFAFSSFWSIKEIFEQEERVRKGWFPKNPRRKYKRYPLPEFPEFTAATAPLRFQRKQNFSRVLQIYPCILS